MNGATHNILVALVGALLTGAPALVYAIWKGRRLAPKEENELVARMAGEAVAAGNEMLESARHERKEMLRKIQGYEERCAAYDRRVADLERQVHEKEP